MSHGCSVRTPSYRPVKHLADQLGAIAAGLTRSSGQLGRLLQEVPRQLAAHREAAGQLHSLAFPPGQQPAASAAAASAAGSAAAGSCAASVASTSAQSRHSASSSAASGGQRPAHPAPLLRLQELSEAQAAVEAACRAVGVEAGRLVAKQNDAARLLNSHKAERGLERSVMALFFTAPGQLADAVAALREQVAALEAA